VHAHAERLGQGGHVIVQSGRNDVQALARGRVADEQAVGQPAPRAAVADHVAPRPGVQRHPVAGSDAVDLGADRLDDTGHLVAERHRRGAGPREPTQAHVPHVGAADATGGRSDDRVARPRLAGIGDLVESHVTRTVDAHLSHHRRLRSPRGAVPRGRGQSSNRAFSRS
jgi:hypothetical protein